MDTRSSINRKYVTTCHINQPFVGSQDEITKIIDSNPRIRNSPELANELTSKKISRKLSFNENQIPTTIPNGVSKTFAAVIVRDAVKSYGSSGAPVLNNFSMTVEKGTIYSLLGASGSGKTTLLSCVVGIRNLQGGEILVFGGKPGTKESGIPGKRVGYMSQEIALYNDFSIKESLQYFGTLFGMESEDIDSSQDFLLRLLDLPDASRRVGTLSGGQKRRVSLAVSLIHSPELLILDEPTVGMDPLLRLSIWNHLCKLVSTQGTTVIITTHYIEEARLSNTIGLMRGGRLLAEKSPLALLEEHNTDLLEDIVLKLCRNDNFNKSQQNSIAAIDERTQGRKQMSSFMMDSIYDSDTMKDTLTRIRALLMKNVTVMMRNFLLVIFLILLPTIQVTVVCLCIGNDPKPMWMGVVNKETSYTDNCLTLPLKVPGGGCDVEYLSCQFLSKLPKDTIFIREYKTEELARNAIRHGNVWGFITFPEGYSDHVYTRSSSGNIVENSTLQGSQIYFEMDYSNKQISLALKRIFYDGYKDFIRELLSDCGFHPELGEAPVKYLEPIYGTDDTDFREFVAPSVLLGILFFFPLCSSGISYIWDKKQGTMERAQIAGVRTAEIMTAYFMVEGCILLIQSAISLFILTVVFGITIKGSVLLASSLPILMGLSGVSMGFLIGSLCTEEIQAVLLSITLFFPNFVLAGLLWPSQSLPIVLKYISYFLPCTLASESFRSIITRGWEFTHPNVWKGFASTGIWIIVYWSVTIFVHKILLKKK